VARLGPGARPSFFELLLGAAVILGRAWGAEALLVEAGIGGRGDATSRLAAQAVALVSVGEDHLDKLGPTLAEVAAEKAGLARPGEALIVGPGLSPELVAVVHAAAAPGVRVTQAASLVVEGVPYATVELPGLGPARLSLAGAHQAENAAVVAAVWAELHRQGLVPLDALLGVTEARWPGRLELLPGAPAWLLDGAHNPPGVAALAQVLPAYCVESDRVLLVGVSGGHEAALLALAAIPGELHLIGGFYRAAPVETQMALLPPGRVTARWPDVPTALAALSTRRDKALIVVAGSLFLVGAAREVLAP
jgi:dihydrofolate synthase/folylpolyglutamate synthase